MMMISVHILFTKDSCWAEANNPFCTRYQMTIRHSQELYLVSNLGLKEPICIQSVLRNVVVNPVRRLAVPNNLLVEISSSSSKL